jgi:hypothetical protein
MLCILKTPAALRSSEFLSSELHQRAARHGICESKEDMVSTLHAKTGLKEFHNRCELLLYIFSALGDLRKLQLQLPGI